MIRHKDYRPKYIYLLLSSILSLPMYGQVYPYDFCPVKNSSEGRMYGLVNAENEKITEPLFGFIDPFLNQEYNDYTIYSTIVANPPGSQYLYHDVKGLIDKEGKVVDGISDPYLVYDGNGRMAYIPGDSLDTYFNLKTHKTFNRSSKEQVNHIARGITYYLLLFDSQNKIYTVINEHGKAWPIETQPYQEVAYVKTINNMPVYQVTFSKNTFLYYDGEGHVVSENKIYPHEDIEGIDVMYDSESEFGSSSSMINLSEASRQKILAIYPDYSLGKPFYEKSGAIKYVEIINKYQRVGLVDLDGHLILECAYTKLTPLLSDFDDDEKDDKFYVVISDYSNSGLMNMNGKVLFKPGFGFITFRKNVNLFSLMGPNGYSGFCDGEGHIFLPKECGCIQEYGALNK